MKPASVYYVFWENKFIFNILVITVCYWTTCAKNNAAFFSHPPRKTHVTYHHYDSGESGYLSCFKGHMNTPSGYNMHGNFIWHFLALGKSGLVNMAIFFCMITVMNTILTRPGTYMPHSQRCNFFQQVLQTCVKFWFNSDCWRNFLWGLCVPHQNLK